MDIKQISAGANCYLLQGDNGFVLVDTGQASARKKLLKGLEEAGCRDDGSLRLVVITHADSDHIGNAVFLREIYGAKIAMHAAEAEAAATGRMSCNRKKHPDRMPWLVRLLMPLAERFGSMETFQTDITLEDGQSLLPFGLNASILHLPGHTQGSIAIRTQNGDVFCGDLFWNVRFPRLHMLIDDLPDARASLERLKTMDLRTIYPGHGKPFGAESLP